MNKYTLDHKRMLSLIIIFVVLLAKSVAAMPIEVEGLKHVQKSTIIAHIGHQGDANADHITDQIHRLYKMGFFDDISVMIKDNRLVYRVVERPIIAACVIQNANQIKPDTLDAMKKQFALQKGRFFDRASVYTFIKHLETYYISQGYFRAKVTPKIKRAHGQVWLSFAIKEDQPNQIDDIIIKGGSFFSHYRIRQVMSMSPWRPWSWLTQGNRFSQNQIDLDRHNLTELYRQQGFLDNSINITTVEKPEYHYDVIVHIKQGSRYVFGQVDIQKDPKLPSLSLIATLPGKPFLPSSIVEQQKRFSAKFDAEKHLLYHIVPMTTVDRLHHVVNVVWKINIPKPLYVNRIYFHGNENTDTTILRGQMLMQEGGMFNTSKLMLSKQKLQNLRYLGGVDVDVIPVEGRNDLLDIHWYIQERKTLTAMVQASYVDGEGFVYGLHLGNDNFLGMGRSVKLDLDHSKVSERFGFDYEDPNHDGSLYGYGYGIFWNRFKADHYVFSNYYKNSLGAYYSIKYPVSDHAQIQFGAGARRYEIRHYANASNEIVDYINKYGQDFNAFSATMTYHYTDLNRIIFPSSGQRLTTTLAYHVPFSDRSLHFLKFSTQGIWYHDLSPESEDSKKWVFAAHGAFSRGRSFGKWGDDLPFFERLTTGGIGSVKGYTLDTLGPKDSLDNTYGGNVMLNGGLQIMLPSMLVDDARFSVFVDAGNAYETQIDTSDLRYSAGAMLQWYTPIAPLIFSYAIPIRHKVGDNTSRFQFTIGTEF